MIPFPDHGKRPYAIEVEFELPANAVSWTTPWEQLQTFTRLDGANAVLVLATSPIGGKKSAIQAARR